MFSGSKLLFDIDGTIYPIVEKSFMDSPLNHQVETRTVDYVAEKLKLTKYEAQTLFGQIKKSYPKRYSIGLNRNFDLNRADYLSFVWNVDPAKITPVNPRLINLFSTLSRDCSLYVMSDAPSIWIDNLLLYQGIDSFFTHKFSGADMDLKKKNGLFAYFLKIVGANPFDCLMIGDEIENDIVPAKRCGMQTALISPVNCAQADFVVQNIFGLEKIVGRENEGSS